MSEKKSVYKNTLHLKNKGKQKQLKTCFTIDTKLEKNIYIYNIQGHANTA